ncbi:CC142 protein, partial [Caloenas nicobarica]|nr:CC142 protein [Caloenas nicobarica]
AARELSRALAQGRWGPGGHRVVAAPSSSPGTRRCCRGVRWPSPRPPAAPVPRECEEELGRLCLRLLCQSVLRGWERDFTRALGSALSDKCSGDPVPAAVPVCSRTARCLQRLYPALAFALRCLR